MDAHMIDSEIFGHQWTTDEARAIFSEPARVTRWIEIVIALARAQASCGIIPVDSANAISRLCDTPIPIDEVARRTRDASHSTLGMIQVLRERLPGSCAEHVYYGATVQDISDTSQTLELRDVATIVWRDLWALEDELLELAGRHRNTPMVGRTHGQPGSPISFGFKVASWADEIGRHLQRMKSARALWLVGQFGGAVGTLAFFEDRAMELRAEFCRRLELAEPEISWINARDRVADFAGLAAMVASSAARIANEVYALQRREIGELSERTNARTVGSITMPHKRNPEASEQIVALARMVRAHAGALIESMVQEHERDARSWKVEWAAFPALCHYVLAAVAMTRTLIEGLEVNEVAMWENLGFGSSSERILSLMSARLGKHRAQALLQEVFRQAREEGRPVAELLKDLATQAELAELEKVDIGAAGLMVDRVIEAARSRRSSESEIWSGQ